MASLDSLVTDSAAAASAWASGSRICNWAINTLPDGRTLTAIGTLAKGSGRGVGLVTTTRITHATPAAFAAAVPKRDMEEDIALQYVDVADVLLGGGLRQFDPESRKDKRNLLAEYREQGYRVCRSRQDLPAANKPQRILGLFHASHLPYEIDARRDPAIRAAVPSLAELTRVALEVLAAADQGFLLQVEGGRVDHAAHDNDAPALLWDQLAFDDAVAVVIDFCSQRSDTLVIITTDHGCGSPTLNGTGPRYNRSDEHFAALSGASASMEAVEARLARWKAEHAGADPSPAAVAEALHWATGIDISERDAQVIADVVAGKAAPELASAQANVHSVTAQILGNHTGIAWTGIVHTSDWAPLMAFGPGSERFRGLLRNTAAFDHMTALWGIEHRNPSMTAEDARRFKRAAAARARVTMA